MIRGIGASTATPVDARQGTGTATRIDAPSTRAASANGPSVATTVGRIAAEGAPIDDDRVAALRAAIRAGTYRADADAIATKMIAGDLA